MVIAHINGKMLTWARQRASSGEAGIEPGLANAANPLPLIERRIAEARGVKFAIPKVRVWVGCAPGAH